MRTPQDIIREDSLARDFIRDAFRYKKILKSYGKQNKNVLHCYNTNTHAHIVAESLHNIRNNIRNLLSEDTLAVKQRAFEYGVKGKEEVRYYKNQNTGDLCWNTNETGWDYTEKTIQTYVVGKDTPNADIWSSYIKLTPFYFWPDEMKDYIRTKGNTKLHHKFEYIRHNGQFYSRDKFFEYKNEIYPKDKYAVYNGELLDLTKVLKISSSINGPYRYRHVNKFNHTYYLLTDDEEEFVPKSPDNDFFIVVKPYFGDFAKDLLGKNFLSTMFINNKKRYYNNTSSYWLYFNKEECACLDIEPSAHHKEVYEEIEKDFLKANEGRTNFSTKESVRKEIMNSIRYSISLTPDLVKGIFGQIFKEMFPKNRNFTYAELKSRLKVVRELLKKEKEYAK